MDRRIAPAFTPVSSLGSLLDVEEFGIVSTCKSGNSDNFLYTALFSFAISATASVGCRPNPGGLETGAVDRSTVIIGGMAGAQYEYGPAHLTYEPAPTEQWANKLKKPTSRQL